MVPEDLSEEGKIVKVKFKFGDIIEEVTYNKDLMRIKNEAGRFRYFY